MKNKENSMAMMVSLFLMSQLFLSIVFSTFMNLRFAQRAIVEDASIYAEAILLGIIRTVQLSSLDAKSNQALVASMATERNIREIVVTDGEFIIKNHSQASKIGGLSGTVQQTVSGERDQSYFLSEGLKGEKLLTVVRPLETVAGKVETIGYALIETDISEKIASQWRYQLLNSIILGAFFCMITAALYLSLRKRILSPLLLLKNGFEKICGGERGVRVHFKSRDEFGVVCDNFNEMSETLERTTVSRDSLLKEIEERKRLEHMVLQSEKMSAIGQLAAGVAHEINNPLGVILGFSQNLAKRIQPGDVFELPLRSIEREAIRCKNLVQELLTFSRVGKTEKESLDLKETIESALSLIQAQTNVKSVTLVKELSAVPRIAANRTQIQQVIVNLCNNAVDAMPQGGVLTVQVQKVKMDQGEGIEIQVQDTGHGIPEEIRKKIFDPFFTTKEIGKGTGLGLSLVYEIVEKHHGQISLESYPGKGTTFRIFLPLPTNV